MPVYRLFSLISAILMTLALWISGKVYLEGNTCFVLQVVAYLLLAVSSWLIGVWAAAFVLLMCAVTLILKMLRRYPFSVMRVFLLITLAGGLLVNNVGWRGIPVILASLGVVGRHAYQYKHRLPWHLSYDDSEDGSDQNCLVVLSQMDNANRQRGHALDLFMENIIGTALWGLHAWLVQDYCQIAFRGVELLVNALNYARRIWPVFSAVLCDTIPNPGGSKRKKLPGRKKKRNWII